MNTTYPAQAEAVIEAPPEKVWQALTDPALVRQWLFGTDLTVTAWKVGGKITYRGAWEGKTYEDKGEILAIVPGQKLVSTYWSSFSGLPDAPENYQTVTYVLSPTGTGTKLTIMQEGSKTPEQADHSQSNWRQVLASMKGLLEK
jgi:uncharacterized protein YndB with AHSA1/START domain